MLLLVMSVHVSGSVSPPFTLQKTAQKLWQKKTWQNAVQKHFGKKNIGELAASHSKSAIRV